MNGTNNLLAVSAGAFNTLLVVSLVLGGLVSGYLCFVLSQRFLGILQQQNYESGRYFKWYFKKGNIARRRISLLTLSLVLLLGLFSVCFSFLGYRGANLIAVIPFEFLFLFYLSSERKYALKVKTVYTPRLIRLCVVDAFLCAALSVGLGFGMAAASFAVNAQWFYLLRFVPFALLPLLAPFLVALSNLIAKIYEVPHSKRFVKKAKQTLASSQCVKVGITGSFGKTSVKNFAHAILAERFRVLATPASYNTPLGIARTVNEYGADYDIFLVEMGARRVGDIKELCDMVNPTCGVITGICGQHLETFGSIENIRAEKGVLAARVDTVVLGRTAEGITDKTENVFVYGRDFAAENVVVTPDGTKFILRLGDDDIAVKTTLLGRHMAENLAVAAALGKSFGMEIGEIAAGIERIEPVPHRLQRVPTENGVFVLDDSYNANVEGAKEALEVFRTFPGNRYVVTPGIVELGELEEKGNAELGALLTDFNVILVGETLVHAVRDGYLAAGGNAEKLRIVPTLKAAQELLQKELKEGDSVLFLNDLPDGY